MNEWKLCSAQHFSSFLRSVSLLSTRRRGPWHCNRESEGQWSGYWWKCTVIVWHHWWRWNSTLWSHLWCPGPGWCNTTEKGKLRKMLFTFKISLWNMCFGVCGSWVDFWHKFRAARGLASLAGKNGDFCVSHSPWPHFTFQLTLR